MVSRFSEKSAQAFVLGVGCWRCLVKFLDLLENELPRKHLPKMFSLVKNEGQKIDISFLILSLVEHDRSKLLE